MQLRARFIAGVCGTAFLAITARAAFTVPELTGPVVDQAGMIDVTTERALETGLRALRDQGGSQINVLTVNTLEELPIEQASIQVVDKWKLGGRKNDNGVLLMIALKERRLRIEVGQGLEGSLTDADSKRIIDQAIVPLIRAGDVNSGVLVGVYQIARKTDPTFDLAPYFEGKIRKRAQEQHRSGPGRILIFILVFLAIVALSGRRRRRAGFFGGGWGGGGGFGGGGWGGGGGFGGGSGGGGWSGGCGGFSGGGASGGW